MSHTQNLRLFLAWMISALLVTSLLASPQSSPDRTAPPQQNKAQTNAPPAMQGGQSGQGAQGQESVVRISTQLVQIDAVVTDKNDRHVDDLNENDFELLVDGKPQTISHFVLMRMPEARREATASTKANPKDEAPRPPSMPGKMIEPEKVQRTIAFVVDDLGLSFSSMHYAREAIKKFVDGQMQDGDLVGIIRTGRGLGALQQFTSDRRILYAAIEKLTWNPQSRNMLPRFGEAANDDQDDPAQRANAMMEDLTDNIFSLGTLGALNFVVRGLRELPGRKMAILVSDGLNLFGRNRDNTQVLERVRRLTDLANRAAVVIYSLDAKGLQTLQPTAADNMSGMTGPRLAAQMASASQANFDSQDGLVYLARETGGFAVLNNNDLNLGVQRALRDGESYYLLGFDPEDQQFDKRYHQIKVRIKRPGLQVRTRGGFFGEERSIPAVGRTREEQIRSALYSPFGARDLKLQMTSLFFNLPSSDPNAPKLKPPQASQANQSRRPIIPGAPGMSNIPAPPRPVPTPNNVSFVRSLFHIDCSQLTFKNKEDGWKSVTLDLAAFTYNEEGGMIDQHGRTFTLSFDQEKYRLALAKGIVYTADVPIRKPGAYQFRAVLRDSETGRMGSASQFLQIPDFDKKLLALSGLVLSEARPDVAPSPSAPKSEAEANNQPPANNRTGPSPESNDVQPTPAVRRFARTGELEYNFMIFNAQIDKRTHQPHLTAQVELYRDGKRIYQFPTRQVDASGQNDLTRLMFGGRLQMKNFPPGDYVLRVVIADALAKQKHSRAEQWMDFSVK